MSSSWNPVRAHGERLCRCVDIRDDQKMTVNELADQVKANSAATNAQIAKLQLMLEALMKTRNEDQE